MGRRDLDIVMSASNLTRQYHGYRMAVHAQAYITNDSMPVQYTFADYAGDVNPRWVYPLRFSLNCSFGGSTSPEHLNIDLFNTLTPYGPFCVGSLQIPLVAFLSGAGQGATGWYTLSWRVYPGGLLHLTYRLGPYVSRVPKIVGAIGGIVLDSALESVFSFELNNLFGN